jgi:hypothetical protein
VLSRRNFKTSHLKILISNSREENQNLPRHDVQYNGTQHYDIEHKGLICKTQHKQLSV